MTKHWEFLDNEADVFERAQLHLRSFCILEPTTEVWTGKFGVMQHLNAEKALHWPQQDDNFLAAPNRGVNFDFNFSNIFKGIKVHPPRQLSQEFAHHFKTDWQINNQPGIFVAGQCLYVNSDGLKSLNRHLNPEAFEAFAIPSLMPDDSIRDDMLYVVNPSLYLTKLKIKEIPESGTSKFFPRPNKISLYDGWHFQRKDPLEPFFEQDLIGISGAFMISPRLYRALRSDKVLGGKSKRESGYKTLPIITKNWNYLPPLLHQQTQCLRPRL